MSNANPAANPHIGEKFLLLATITGVYGDESMDISHRSVTVVLDDGQRFETNLRNLLDPQVVVAHIEPGQTSVDVSAAVKGPESVPPPVAQPAPVDVQASDVAGTHERG